MISPKAKHASETKVGKEIYRNPLIHCCCNIELQRKVKVFYSVDGGNMLFVFVNIDYYTRTM